MTDNPIVAVLEIGIMGAARRTWRRLPLRQAGLKPDGGETLDASHPP
jgi:hypothetical protein